MKIALLNLTLDSNYGGNLQRYALVKVLLDMGHEVEHLSLHYVPHISTFGKIVWYIKRAIKKTLIDHNLILSWEKDYLQIDIQRCLVAKPFYDKYIPHTAAIHKKEELNKYLDYDAYIVGSDQVWRPNMTKTYGLSTYFFDFLPANCNAKRLAYGVSLGVTESELSETEVGQLAELYKKFDAVSVREQSSILKFDSYGWTSPVAQFVLDPTLLLDEADYVKLIDENETCPSDGDMFCYILDPTPEKMKEVEQIARDKGMRPFFQTGCSAADAISIPQWLRSFRDADFIYTDSYHGLLFSLIFHKPAVVKYNKKRGNDRFESIAKVLKFDLQETDRDWNRTEQIRQQEKRVSIDFIKASI